MKYSKINAPSKILEGFRSIARRDNPKVLAKLKKKKTKQEFHEMGYVFYKYIIFFLYANRQTIWAKQK
jgi:hypothetical protein